MHVGLGNLGQFVVDHVRNVFNIQSACGDVGGDQHRRIRGLEEFQSPCAYVLTLVAMNRQRGNPGAHQYFGNFVGTMLGPGKHQCATGGRVTQQVGQQLRLVRGLDVVNRLAHLFGRSGHAVHFDVFRRVQPLVCQVADLVGHRGRKHHRLASSRHGRHNAAQGGQKTHVQHLVRFIQCQDRHLRQVDVSLLHQVQQSAGRGHKDIHTSFQRTDLGHLADSTKHRCAT